MPLNVFYGVSGTGKTLSAAAYLDDEPAFLAPDAKKTRRAATAVGRSKDEVSITRVHTLYDVEDLLSGKLHKHDGPVIVEDWKTLCALTLAAIAGGPGAEPDWRDYGTLKQIITGTLVRLASKRGLLISNDGLTVKKGTRRGPVGGSMACAHVIPEHAVSVIPFIKFDEDFERLPQFAVDVWQREAEEEFAASGGVHAPEPEPEPEPAANADADDSDAKPKKGKKEKPEKGGRPGKVSKDREERDKAREKRSKARDKADRREEPAEAPNPKAKRKAIRKAVVQKEIAADSTRPYLWHHTTMPVSWPVAVDMTDITYFAKSPILHRTFYPPFPPMFDSGLFRIRENPEAMDEYRRIRAGTLNVLEAKSSRELLMIQHQILAWGPLLKVSQGIRF